MEDRKARLKALAARAGRGTPKTTTETNDDQTPSQQQQQRRTLNFRNYAPADDRLVHGDDDDDANTDNQKTQEPVRKRSKLANANSGGSAAAAGENQKEEKTALEKALEEAKAEIPTHSRTGEDLVAMAPKKINWDLKRDIQPKLKKLEKRTQRAIVEMLRERIEKEAAEAEDLD